jgi:hypothetical protein
MDGDGRVMTLERKGNNNGDPTVRPVNVALVLVLD